jgi:hypothetical protein
MLTSYSRNASAGHRNHGSQLGKWAPSMFGMKNQEAISVKPCASTLHFTRLRDQVCGRAWCMHYSQHSTALGPENW